MDDDAIRDLVVRLARPRGVGGHSIERAAILAAGHDSAAVEAWILAHAGTPEATHAAAVMPGLHGGRLHDAALKDSPPRRFLLPAHALDDDRPTRSPIPEQELTHATEAPADQHHPDGHAAPERG